MSEPHLSLILAAAFVASASPGPATIGIAELSMRHGRRLGSAFAAGVTTGSIAWSVAAALGLGALMAANAWAFEVVRYGGAAYLLSLAFKSARSALRHSEPEQTATPAGSWRSTYVRGLALHLTNPKPILFFGSLYSLGVSPDVPASGLAMVIVAVGLQSFIIFQGYALLFSHPGIARGYRKLRRSLEAAFALAFGMAGLKVLTARLV